MKRLKKFDVVFAFCGMFTSKLKKFSTLIILVIKGFFRYSRTVSCFVFNYIFRFQGYIFPISRIYNFAFSSAVAHCKCHQSSGSQPGRLECHSQHSGMPRVNTFFNISFKIHFEMSANLTAKFYASSVDVAIHISLPWGATTQKRLGSTSLDSTHFPKYVFRMQ